MAVDLTLIPYHGQPFLDPNEIYRSQPKSGTAASGWCIRSGDSSPVRTWVREEYRKRFGIETSYRQMNQCRTCTRNPGLRLLFVGIALLLRNVWVWFHLNVLAGRHANGRLK